MQFSVIQSRVAEETGLSLTDDATKIKAWINGAYQQLSGFYNWPWLITNFTMQTVADITSLTASVNAAGTAVTLSATHAVSLATNYWIRFDDTSADWYPITAHTAGTNAVTIGNAYIGTTNLTAGACTIRKIYYDMPTGIDRIRDLRQAVTQEKIEIIDPITFDKALPDPSDTGTPRLAYLTGMTSAGLWQMSFHPIPSEIINIQGRGYKAITELSADADVPLIPAKWHGALVFLSLALYGHDYIDDARVKNAYAKAKEIMKEMVKECSPVPGSINVIQAWDARPAGFFGENAPHIWGR